MTLGRERRASQKAATLEGTASEVNSGMRGRDISLAMLLLLAVYAGAIKASPLLAWIPLDLTFVAAAVLLLIVGHETLRKRLDPRVIPLVAILLAAFLPGVFFAAETPYASEKVVRLFILTILCVCLGTGAVITNLRRREAFFWALVGWGSIVAILYFVAPTTSTDFAGRAALAGSDNTIAIARSTGAGLLALVVLCLSRKVRVAIALPVAALFLYVMFASGSRGPLLASAVGVFIFAIAFQSRNRIVTILSLASIGTVVAVWGFNQAGDVARARLLLLFQTDQGRSINARENFASSTWSVISNNPLGIGWGRSSEHIAAFYPHNIVLEVTAEGGWIAGLALVTTTVVCVRRAWTSRADPMAAGLLSVLAFALINAMVSGDLNDNRLFFVVVVACWLTPAPRSLSGKARISLRSTDRLESGVGAEQARWQHALAQEQASTSTDGC